jgi:hypothetical protein
MTAIDRQVLDDEPRAVGGGGQLGPPERWGMSKRRDDGEDSDDNAMQHDGTVGPRL